MFAPVVFAVPLDGSVARMPLGPMVVVVFGPDRDADGWICAGCG